ncbi:MAG: HEPN domain-containing protein [Magnetococcus sp. DMHC-8]
MSRDKAIPGTPNDWLGRAKGDLAMARIPLPDGACFEDLCFHAQQAAEKAIKAVYRHRGFAFRYTHDLEWLLTELARQGEHLPEEIINADSLTIFAWEARYPDPGESVTEREYRDAVQKAEMVVAWAGRVIGR